MNFRRNLLNQETNLDLTPIVDVDGGPISLKAITQLAAPKTVTIEDIIIIFLYFPKSLSGTLKFVPMAVNIILFKTATIKAPKNQ